MAINLMHISRDGPPIIVAGDLYVNPDYIGDIVDIESI